MPKKKQKATPTSNQPCTVAGCKEPGEHKAPRSKAALHDYEWFCLDHVRERNRRWDFFADMDRDEIEAFMRDAVTGHRPTWTREGEASRYWDQLHDALDAFMAAGATRKKQSPSTVHLHARVREALAAFNLDYPYDVAALKTRYRTLVKQFHPDANRGDRKSEETFKQITAAYLVLAEHLQAE